MKRGVHMYMLYHINRMRVSCDSARPVSLFIVSVPATVAQRDFRFSTTLRPRYVYNTTTQKKRFLQNPSFVPGHSSRSYVHVFMIRADCRNAETRKIEVS